MGSYVSKFGFYEFLALLLPGTVFTQACLYFSDNLKDTLGDMFICQSNTEQYIVISIISAFLAGLILQELGTILDRLLFYRLLYGKKPDEAWADECPVRICKCLRWIIKDPTSVAKAKDLCAVAFGDEKSTPDRYFYFMLNTLEANGIEGKAEKMMIASELSRSLALRSAILLLLHLGEVVCCCTNFSAAYVACLIGVIILFSVRKVRYERFRFSTVVRTFVILKENANTVSKVPQL